MECHQGQIVWAEIPDEHNRNTKLRPAVIVTPTEELPTAEKITVVAITSRFSLPLPEGLIELPWHRGGHPRTCLKKRCVVVVVCDWKVLIGPESILEIKGRVPEPHLKRILNILARKCDETADDEDE